MKRYNRLSRYRRKRLQECFCADLTATQAALVLGLNRKTVNRYYGLFREAVARHQEDEMGRLLGGVVEVDESYFGATRVRGRAGRKRGRGTSKQPVFGVFERHGHVFTEVVPDVKAKTLQKVIRGHVRLDSVLISDGWRGYDGLVDVGYDKHLRINKSRTFAGGPVHINGIESFWSFTKRRLAKFNGTRKNFSGHLKECEWRWGKNFDKLKCELSKMMV